MKIITFLLFTFEAICSLLLLGVILIQKARSEGLGMAFGSGMGESLFGSRTGNVLTKATVILAIAFLANTLLLALLMANFHEKSLMERFSGPPNTPPPPSVATPPLPVSGAPASFPPPTDSSEPSPVDSSIEPPLPQPPTQPLPEEMSPITIPSPPQDPPSNENSP